MGSPHIDAVVVNPVLEAEDAVGQLADGRPRHPFGVVDHLVHVDQRGFDAVTLDQVQERPLRDVAGRELGAQVAHDLHWNADVLLDDLEQGFVGLAPFVQLQRRNAQAFLIDLGGVGGVRPGDASAHVGVVADGRGEGQALAVQVDGLEDEDVGQVHAAGKGVVEGVDVARPHPIAEAIHDFLERGGNRAQVAGDGQSLGHQPAVGGGKCGGVVHVGLEHAGVGGAKDGQGHLVGDGEDRALEQLERDGVVDLVHGGSSSGCRRY